MTLGGWEGNRGSGIAVTTMSYGLQWRNYLQAEGLGMGGEHPVYATLEYGTFFTFMFPLAS